MEDFLTFRFTFLGRLQVLGAMFCPQSLWDINFFIIFINENNLFANATISLFSIPIWVISSEFSDIFCKENVEFEFSEFF
jgi:hypothetical protein